MGIGREGENERKKEEGRRLRSHGLYLEIILTIIP